MRRTAPGLIGGAALAGLAVAQDAADTGKKEYD